MDISWKLILYQAANFVVLMLVLGFIFNKFITPFLKKRAEGIQKQISEAEAGRRDVEKLKKQYEYELVQMKEKVRGEIDKATIEGNGRREQIVIKAEKDAIDLIEKARGEIEHEKNRAIFEVRKVVVSLSIAAAEQVIKKQIDDAQNRKLVEDFIGDLEKNPKSLR